MIGKKLADLLRAQIKSELTAHQTYFAISLYFRRASLDGWGRLFREQAMEEAQHASKIIDFLLDTETHFDLPALGAVSTKFGSPREAVEAALASEKRVTSEFTKMAKVADDEDDAVGFQFLQWFLEEQVEEEAKMKKLLDLIDSGVNLFQAEPLLEKME